MFELYFYLFWIAIIGDQIQFAYLCLESFYQWEIRRVRQLDSPMNYLERQKIFSGYRPRGEVDRLAEPKSFPVKPQIRKNFLFEDIND